MKHQLTGAQQMVLWALFFFIIILTILVLYHSYELNNEKKEVFEFGPELLFPRKQAKPNELIPQPDS
jgi:hypothetical protein